MLGNPNRAKEKAAGYGGAALASPWVFLGVLRIVDWLGRAQTAMTVAPYLGVLSTPLAFVLELVGVAGLLFYATRLEHYREAEETPLIIRPWTEPEKPKRHWFWIKLSIVSGIVSAVLAIVMFVFLRHNYHQVTPTIASAVPVLPTPSPVAITKPKAAKKVNPSDTTPRVSDPISTAGKPSLPTMSSSPDSAKPIIIPVPDQSNTIPKPEDVSRIARIGGIALIASQKPADKLYVAFRFSQATTYRIASDARMRNETSAIKTALENTGKVVPFEGSISISGDGISFQQLLTPDNQKIIYYFYKHLGAACNSISSVVSPIVDEMMACSYYPANDASFRNDFLTLSGLDMEMVF